MSKSTSSSTEFHISVHYNDSSLVSLFARQIIHPDSDNDWICIVVHGGPGLSDHSESFEGLKRLPVHSIVFYDQLGRSSDQPSDAELYSLNNYVEELHQVVLHIVTATKLPSSEPSQKKKQLCLLGHSWGGQIVMDYLLSTSQRSAEEVKCAIISNAPLDELSYQNHQIQLRSHMDPGIRQFLEIEEQEQFGHDTSTGSMIFRKLVGESETNITGQLKGWSCLDRLHRLSVPCLFVAGDDDTVPCRDYERLLASTSESSLVQVLILKGAGHGPFYGPSSDSYFAAIRSFLKKVEEAG